MDKVHKFGLMVQDMMENGKMTKSKDMERFIILIKIFTKVNLLLAKPTDMENTLKKKEKSMKGFGQMTNLKVKEN